VHPAAAARHRGRLARASSPGPRSASRAEVHGAFCVSVSALFKLTHYPAANEGRLLFFLFGWLNLLLLLGGLLLLRAGLRRGLFKVLRHSKMPNRLRKRHRDQRNLPSS
jgi:hypothetical protein